MSFNFKNAMFIHAIVSLIATTFVYFIRENV